MDKCSGFESSGFIKSEEILNVFVFGSGEFLDQLNTYLAAEGFCTVDVVYESPLSNHVMQTSKRDFSTILKYWHTKQIIEIIIIKMSVNSLLEEKTIFTCANVRPSSSLMQN
jgi:hypothetical protein